MPNRKTLSQSLPSNLRAEKKIVFWGLLVNILLIVSKLAGGLLLSSLALIADGIHSLSDMFTDLIVLWGLKMASRPADENHHYGHGKLETLASLIVAVILLTVSLGIMEKAFTCFRYGPPHLIDSRWILGIALISVLLKEILYRKTIALARSGQSPALKANAWHHRSDALSSLVVFIGAVASWWGWAGGDLAAALIVGIMIAYVALKMGYQGLAELLETAVAPEIQVEIENTINRFPDIISWHNLRSRRVGREVFLDLHIIVPGEMTVAISHKVAHRLEEFIKQSLPYRLNIMIHIEPDEVSI